MESKEQCGSPKDIPKKQAILVTDIAAARMMPTVEKVAQRQVVSSAGIRLPYLYTICHSPGKTEGGRSPRPQRGKWYRLRSQDLPPETCLSSEDRPLPSWSSSASLNPCRKQSHIPGVLVQGPTQPLPNTIFIA